MLGTLDAKSFAWILGIIVFGAAILVLLAAIPGLVAGHRRVANANSVSWLGVIGIFIPPVWIVALCWAFLAPGQPQTPTRSPSLQPKSSRKEAADLIANAMNRQKQEKIRQIARRRP